MEGVVAGVTVAMVWWKAYDMVPLWRVVGAVCGGSDWLAVVI